MKTGRKTTGKLGSYGKVRIIGRRRLLPWKAVFNTLTKSRLLDGLRKNIERTTSALRTGYARRSRRKNDSGVVTTNTTTGILTTNSSI